MGPFHPDQVQLHDVNPGDLNEPGLPNHFPDGGVFWTKTVPNSSIHMKPGKGDAHFNLHNMELTEYFDVVNAIFRNGAAPIGATGSVDVIWHGNGERAPVENDNVADSGIGFAGKYEGANIDISWSITNDNGYYFSTVDPNEEEPVITSAFTAHVRTGMFHP